MSEIRPFLSAPVADYNLKLWDPRAPYDPLLHCDYHVYEEDFRENEYNENTINDLFYLCEKYKRRSGGRVLRGRNRNVFILPGNIVVKIPTCIDGFSDNDWEGSVYSTEEDDHKRKTMSSHTLNLSARDVQFARTRLAYYHEIPVLFMEYVEHADSYDIIKQIGFEPDWVMSVDCQQVGFNQRGLLVAYDYGLT